MSVLGNSVSKLNIQHLKKNHITGKQKNKYKIMGQKEISYCDIYVIISSSTLIR